MRGTATVIIMIKGELEKFAALKFPRKFPIVLLVKEGWWQGKTLGSEEGKKVVHGLLGAGSRERKLNIWSAFHVHRASL